MNFCSRGAQCTPCKVHEGGARKCNKGGALTVVSAPPYCLYKRTPLDQALARVFWVFETWGNYVPPSALLRTKNHVPSIRADRCFLKLPDKCLPGDRDTTCP